MRLGAKDRERLINNLDNGRRNGRRHDMLLHPLAPRYRLDEIKVLGLSWLVARIPDDLIPLVDQTHHVRLSEICVCGVVVTEEDSLPRNGFQPHCAL